MTRSRAACLALPLLAAACDDRNDGVGDGPHCEDTVTDLALDAASPLGFSGAEVQALGEGTHAATFTWYDDTVSDLTLVVTGAGAAARYVDSEAVYPDHGGATPAIGIVCDDRVEVDVAIDFDTSGGAFAETWDTVLSATTLDAATWHVDLDPAAIAGTFDFDARLAETGEDYDDSSLWASGSFDAAGLSSGQVMGQMSGGGPCDPGDTCTAWAGEVPVGSWGGG